MSLYSGCSCPICAKIFENTDDVVVCPVCGSPHHRACYKAVGHCGNEDYHAEGRQWEGPATADVTSTVGETVHEGETGNTVICRSCGASNPAQSCFCHACGQRVTAMPQGQGQGQSTQFGGQQRNELFAEYMQQQNLDFGQVLEDGVTVQEACDYVGQNSLPFALRFRQIAHGGMSFNWCAFLFSYFYCFYRKMYKLGAIMFGIFVLTLIPSGYFSMLAIQDIMNAGVPLAFPIAFVTDGAGYQGLLVMSMISRMVSLGTMMFCGLFFNRMYYKQMIKDVTTVRSTGRHPKGSPDYNYAVAASGGVNRSAVLMLCATIFVLYMAIGYFATLFLL